MHAVLVFISDKRRKNVLGIFGNLSILQKHVFFFNVGSLITGYNFFLSLKKPDWNSLVLMNHVLLLVLLFYDSCVQRFAKEWTRKQHERLHLGVKPYVCHVCDAKYSQKTSLDCHVRTHHSSKHGF